MAVKFWNFKFWSSYLEMGKLPNKVTVRIYTPPLPPPHTHRHTCIHVSLINAHKMLAVAIFWSSYSMPHSKALMRWVTDFPTLQCSIPPRVFIGIFSSVPFVPRTASPVYKYQKSKAVNLSSAFHQQMAQVVMFMNEC